jgi:hypothetical protein
VSSSTVTSGQPPAAGEAGAGSHEPDEPSSVAPAAESDAPAAKVGIPLEAIEGLARALETAGDSARRIAVVGERRNVGATLAAITLARALAKQGRVVLVDLALESPNLSVIASDPDAPGVSELVLGSASFGQIITRDRYSRIHVITAGKTAADRNAIMSSQRLSITSTAGNLGGAVCSVGTACGVGGGGNRWACNRGGAGTIAGSRIPECQRAWQCSNRPGIRCRWTASGGLSGRNDRFEEDNHSRRS